jgi:hypothetical protein
MKVESAEQWAEITPAMLGFPEFPFDAVPKIRGKCMAYMPGMKATGAGIDWYFIQWHTGNIRNYIASGGDMNKAIIHHLSYDNGVINPLWGGESFHKRAARMKELGVRYVLAADFSSWANYAVALQLYNYYRSAVVACDFAQAGFQVIPLVCWSAPQIATISILQWPEKCPTVVVDCCHIGTKGLSYNEKLFWWGAEMMPSLIEPEHVLLWANKEEIVKTWNRRVTDGPRAEWVPSRSYVTALYGKLQRKSAPADVGDPDA